MANNEHRNHPIGYKYTCGVPIEHCTGHRFSTSHGLTGTSQTHGHNDPQSAFDCRRKSLLRQGYKQLDGRAFQPPPHIGGEVLVLTKPSRFGNKLRGGKGTRYIPTCAHPGVALSKSGAIASY